MKLIDENRPGLRRHGAAAGLSIGITVSLALMAGGVMLKGVVRPAEEKAELSAITTSAESVPTLQFDLSGIGDTNWRTNSIWYDGSAEYATYAAKRPAYGTARNYEAVLITNKQQMDPTTTTKSANWEAPKQVEVFKHNLREVFATENYDYKFLTTTFIRSSDLQPFKLTMSSQEDCGATFKHFVVGERRVAVDTYVYFPDGGPNHVEYTKPNGFQFQDGLSLSLRGFPFAEAERAGSLTRSMMLLPDQTNTHRTPARPLEAVITFEGRETLSLPIGEVEAYRLKVVLDGEESRYWFAVDGESDWLHLMVKYEGPFGVEYELKAKKWWAYWERG